MKKNNAIHKCFIGIGANLNDPAQQIKTGIQQLDQSDHIDVSKVSSFYQSKAIGPPQPDYINAVVEVKTSLSAEALLKTCQGIETKQGRTRDVHWGPRTLDLDILLYDEQSICVPNLRIPHPEIEKRAFVLIPLFEIAPTLKLPNGTSLKSLVKDDLSAQLTQINNDESFFFPEK